MKAAGIYFVIAELHATIYSKKKNSHKINTETRESQLLMHSCFLMHSCSTDKYSDRDKVHGAKWQNHSSSIPPTKQLRGAQPIGKASVNKVLYTAL